MFCKNCGNKLEEDSKFCNKCGVEIYLENSNSINIRTNKENKELKSEKIVFICLFIFAVCVLVYSAINESRYIVGISFMAVLFFAFLIDKTNKKIEKNN